MKMSNKINKKLLFISLIFISLVLVSAYVIEYKLGHKPCNLCVYERIPYFVSILLIIKILFTKGYEKITFLLLFLVFIISSALAFYHFGIEQGFFTESLVCKDEVITNTLTKEQILEQLKNSAISCKEVSFRILGISLASINTIFSIVLCVIFLKLFLSYGKN